MAESRATKVGDYVEILAEQALATQVGAYVELVAPQTRATMVGAYVELVAPQTRATMVGAYVELEVTFDSTPPIVYAHAYSPYGIVVSLTYDGDENPDSFYWQWSADGVTWSYLSFTAADRRYVRHAHLSPATTYYYRAAAYKDAVGNYSEPTSATTLTVQEQADGIAIWIDVRDASNNKLGPGPLTEIVGWRNVRRLSRAGEFSVEFPATYLRLHQIQDDGNPLLHTDRYLYCYGILDGAVTLLGAGIVKEIELTRRAGAPPLIAASGPDLLGELRRVTVYTDYRPWQYDLDNVNNAPTLLVETFAIAPELPADWTITWGDPTLTLVTAKFVHSSVLGALIDVGAKIGEHFRLGITNDGRNVYWLSSADFFNDCGVRAELSAQPVAADRNPDLCLITDISEIKDSWDLYVRAFVFGAGQGHDRLDLSAVSRWPDGHRHRSTITSIHGTLGTVTVQTAENHQLTVGEPITVAGTTLYDGTFLVDAVNSVTEIEYSDSASGATETSGYLYGDDERTINGEAWHLDRSQTSLENYTARTTYGHQRTALQFKEISPLSNATADVTTAADALLAAAYNWLRTRDEPAKFYRLSVAKLDTLLLPGQTIHVTAKGWIEHTAYLNIDTDLYILEVSNAIGRGGVRTTGLVVATTDRWPTSDGDQAAQEFHQAEVYQSLAQLGPSVDTISYLDYLDDDTGVTFHFFLGEETVAVNSVLVRFRTDKLRSTVKSVGGSSTTTDSGGGATPTTSSGGGATPTSESSGGATETTDSGSGHTHEIDLADSVTGTAVYFAGVGTPPEGDLRTSGGGQINTSSTGSGHTHDVTIPGHTHDVTIPGHTHDVTIAAHTHDVTAAISAEYGIYEDPGTAYGPTALEFSINSGAWRSDYSAISGASGWYALDITDAVTGVAQRPLRVANSVAVRVKAASLAGNKAQITAQIERRCVIQSIAQF